MKKLTVLLPIALFALPAGAEEIDKTLDAASDGHVDVSNIAGEVTIRGWSRNEVEVTGELGRNVEKLIFERDGDKITIKVKVPRKGGRGIESDLHVQVPEGSSIDVGTVSADIDVSDVSGEQSLSTVSGDVNTEAFGNDISAEAVSGDVEVSGQGRNIEISASTVSGDVTLFRVGGVVEAGSVSGDVIVDEGSFERVGLETVNGEIVFHAELRTGGKLNVETVNGDVDLKFTEKVSGRYDIDTFNGDIRNCYGPKAERTSKYTPGWELSFEEGDGNARITVSTLNGDISICD
ncbi:MAG: DUF4097 domain-containing protein [Gammaproteobacteria bacterium]|nr:DUF4097 domain-containing protein [Gammaproteobacteria bacterium]MDH5619651.1 DUF4097 domain-containing protein [Gammaproteobacteria bacterium]